MRRSTCWCSPAPPASSKAIRTSTASSRCRRGAAPCDTLALIGTAVQAIRSRGVDPGRRPPDILRVARRPPARRPDRCRRAARSAARSKPALLHRSTVAAPAIHRVEQMLRLADALGIPRVPEVVCPAAAPLPFSPGDNYAVIHAAPMFRYKEWTPQGWRALAEALTQRGLSVVAIGGPDPAERRASRRRSGRATSRSISCPGRRTSRCCKARGCSSDRTPRRRISPRRPAARRWRCSARPIRGCGGRGRPAGSTRRGRPAARSRIAATSGWCKIRCLACRASSKAASATSAAPAPACRN